jgi:hypothetical protein
VSDWQIETKQFEHNLNANFKKLENVADKKKWIYTIIDSNKQLQYTLQFWGIEKYYIC